MVVDVCTLTLLIGVIAGVIFYLHGWGPTPGVRGLESRPGTRGVLLVAATGIVLLLLDVTLYRTPGFAYFTSYFLGVAGGWLGLLALSAVLHILWGIGRARSFGRIGRLARVSRLVLEGLGLAVPESPPPVVVSTEPAPVVGPQPGGNGADDGLFRMQERLKREDPAAYLDFERLRLEGAQRELELHRGNLERLWQEYARVRGQPEKAAAEVIAHKHQVIAALNEELAKARRFYAAEPNKLHAALAEYDQLLADQEHVRDEIQSLLGDLQDGRAARDDLVRVVIYQKINQQTAGGITLGKVSVGERRIVVHHGDITALAADAIVSSDNNYLTMSDGVARRIRDRGGEEIYQETRRLIPLRRGDVGITGAGRLPVRRVFHAVVLDFDERQGPTEEVIRELVRNAMRKAKELNYHRLVFPVLGAGAGGFPAVAAFRAMLEQMSDELGRPECPIQELILCLTGQMPEMIDVPRALREIETNGDEE